MRPGSPMCGRRGLGALAWLCGVRGEHYVVSALCGAAGT